MYVYIHVHVVVYIYIYTSNYINRKKMNTTKSREPSLLTETGSFPLMRTYPRHHNGRGHSQTKTQLVSVCKFKTNVRINDLLLTL